MMTVETVLASSVQGNAPKKILQLFPGDAVGQLTNAIYEAIVSSLATADGTLRNPTMAEKRRRFAICMDWAVVLRAELKWGVRRIADAMPEILKTELSGEKWQPAARQCWIPSDGR